MDKSITLTAYLQTLGYVVQGEPTENELAFKIKNISPIDIDFVRRLLDSRLGTNKYDLHYSSPGVHYEITYKFGDKN